MYFVRIICTSTYTHRQIKRVVRQLRRTPQAGMHYGMYFTTELYTFILFIHVKRVELWFILLTLVIIKRWNFGHLWFYFILILRICCIHYFYNCVPVNRYQWTPIHCLDFVQGMNEPDYSKHVWNDADEMVHNYHDQMATSTGCNCRNNKTTTIQRSIQLFYRYAHSCWLVSCLLGLHSREFILLSIYFCCYRFHMRHCTLQRK